MALSTVGEVFPASQFTRVAFVHPMLAQTCSCVYPAFTLAAFNVILIFPAMRSTSFPGQFDKIQPSRSLI
jgi:hypothetical protein